MGRPDCGEGWASSSTFVFCTTDSSLAIEEPAELDQNLKIEMRTV